MGRAGRAASAMSPTNLLANPSRLNFIRPSKCSATRFDYESSGTGGCLLFNIPTGVNPARISGVWMPRRDACSLVTQYALDHVRRHPRQRGERRCIRTGLLTERMVSGARQKPVGWWKKGHERQSLGPANVNRRRCGGRLRVLACAANPPRPRSTWKEDNIEASCARLVERRDWEESSSPALARFDSGTRNRSRKSLATNKRNRHSNSHMAAALALPNWRPAMRTPMSAPNHEARATWAPSFRPRRSAQRCAR